MLHTHTKISQTRFHVQHLDPDHLQISLPHTARRPVTVLSYALSNHDQSTYTRDQSNCRADNYRRRPAVASTRAG